MKSILEFLKSFFIKKKKLKKYNDYYIKTGSHTHTGPEPIIYGDKKIYNKPTIID